MYAINSKSRIFTPSGAEAGPDIGVEHPVPLVKDEVSPLQSLRQKRVDCGVDGADSEGIPEEEEGYRLQLDSWTQSPTQKSLKGNFSEKEQQILFQMHKKMGNRWVEIARRLPGRSDNDTKNLFYSKVRAELRRLNNELKALKRFRRVNLSRAKYFKLLRMVDKDVLEFSGIPTETVADYFEKLPRQKKERRPCNLGPSGITLRNGGNQRTPGNDSYSGELSEEPWDEPPSLSKDANHTSKSIEEDKREESKLPPISNFFKTEKRMLIEPSERIICSPGNPNFPLRIYSLQLSRS